MGFLYAFLVSHTPHLIGDNSQQFAAGLQKQQQNGVQSIQCSVFYSKVIPLRIIVGLYTLKNLLTGADSERCGMNGWGLRSDVPLNRDERLMQAMNYAYL
jgi:hypothetical protein